MDTIREIKNANKIINQIFTISDEKNRLDDLAETEQNLEKKNEKKPTWIYVVGVLCLFGPVFNIVADILGFFLDLFLNKMNEEVAFVIAFFVDLVISSIVALIILIIGILTLEKVRKNQFRKHQENAIQYRKQAQEKETELNEFVKRTEKDLEIIPTKYRYPLATNYIEEIFENGRASTIPEALDKFEEYLHRLHVEESLKQNLEIQQQQFEELKKMMLWDIILG